MIHFEEVQMAEPQSQLSVEEIRAQDGADLPQREVMSIIMPDTSLLGGMPDTGATTPSGGTAGSATGMANDAAGLAQSSAAGQQSGTPSVTDAPRSEVISQSDTATATS